MNCFWCGEKVSVHSATHYVGGVPKVFCRGMWKDCLNEFLKWTRNNHHEVPTLQLVKRVRAARSIH